MTDLTGLASSPRIRLVVLFGGQSAEHDVSCTTAAHVVAAADPAKYEVVPIGISRLGQWAIADDTIAALQAGPAALPAALSPVGSATVPAAALAVPENQQVVVLPLLHGPMGEDGTMQGLLEIAGVPYVGAGVLGSAIAMDKAKAKEILALAGIPQTRWITINESLFDGDSAAIADQLGFPCFVKPANMGSSVGVSRADTLDELDTALALAFRYDEWVVVEEGVTAREIEFAVLGNHTIDVSVPGEIVPGAEFYSYDDKYVDGAAKLVIPAELPAEAVDEMVRLAEAAYRILRVEGMARADFLYEEGGRGPLLNELNTIPGFTPISMYPKLWAASGLPYADLIDRLVELAIERHERRTAKRVTDR
ncbi:MAG: D-alanine--D-alanine ligase family protein [Acidimicrobiales bacterium]